MSCSLGYEFCLVALEILLLYNFSLTKAHPPKKVVLFPEMGWVETFLSPSRPHKSNEYGNVYFLFQKNTKTKKLPVANLFI